MLGLVFDGEKAEIRDDLEVRAPGPTEVKVQVVAAGLCHSDISVIDGTIPWQYPCVLGHEGAGIVAEVGEAVTNVKPGDHVVLHTLAFCGLCKYCVTGQPARCRKSLGNASQPFLLGGEPALGFVELVEYDDLFGSAVFRVKDDSYATYYKVYIQKFKDAESTSLRCACPYNLGDICRHEAAGLFQLQELIDRGHLQAEHIQYDQKHTTVKMKTIELKSLRLFSSPEVFADAEKFLRTNKAAASNGPDADRESRSE
jgi:Zn-dependent alcohol dehydrogenase